MTEVIWLFLKLLIILRLDFISLTRGDNICGKLSDIDLRNHKAFMNFVQIEDGSNYGVANAFDRNPSTRVSTYDKFQTGPVPPKYLDNGYNWVLVELDTTKFQMVDSITLLQRTDIDKPTLMRISEIEVLVSNKIDNYPTSSSAGRISWNSFVTCGTTGTATGDPTVVCSQNVIDSNYVAIRRNRESGSNDTSYCCFDFAEFKVNLAVQLDQPKISPLTWIENNGALITTITSVDCFLPNYLRMEWTLNMLNGSKVQLSGSSPTLTIPILTRLNSGTYYYTVYNENGGSIFQSSNTDQINVMYKSFIRNYNKNFTFYEYNKTTFSCSSTGGYPYPTRISTQFMLTSSNTTNFTNDANYGREVSSSLQVTLDRTMNLHNLNCFLQQPNFTDTTTNVPIMIYYSAGSLSVSHTNTQLNEGDTFEMNCSTSSYGYPPPFISFSVDDVTLKSSSSVLQDAYHGELVMAKIFLNVRKEWNNTNVTCTLQQEGFSIQSISTILNISFFVVAHEQPISCGTVCIVLISLGSLLLVAILVLVIIIVVRKMIHKPSKHVDEQSKGTAALAASKYKESAHMDEIEMPKKVYKSKPAPKVSQNVENPAVSQSRVEPNSHLKDPEKVYVEVKIRQDRFAEDKVSINSRCSYAEFVDDSPGSANVEHRDEKVMQTYKLK